MNKQFYFTIAAAVLLNLYSAVGSAQVYINELMASNMQTALDPDYNQSGDWIELYNSGTARKPIGGYFLTDNLNEPQKWMIPEGTEIEAKSYLLFWADDYDSGLHTSFKLSANGEAVGFVSPDGTILDEITFGEQISDVSYGRNGGNEWVFMNNPTPGEANDSETFDGITPTPASDVEGGFFSSAVTVSLSPAQNGDEIYYTTDGSLPTKQSSKYTSALLFDETTTLRVRSFRPGYLGSFAVNNTYFINGNEHDLPVISLTSDSVLLYDEESGLFVDVYNDTEIPAGLEYFEANGIRAFSGNAGISIFGGKNRDVPLISLEVQFRNKYGMEAVNYQIFENNERDRFDSFNLRVKDWTPGEKGNMLGLLLTDPLQHSILEGEMDLEVSSYQPVVVYLNGKYRGIHNLRERQNEEYISYYHGEDPDNLDIFRLNKADLSGDTVIIHNGDSVHFANLVSYLNSNDLTQAEPYEYVKTQIDIKSFVNYHIVENYYANIDWPDNNQKLWRPRREGGKWRWILFDMDFGFNTFKWTTWPVWESWRRDMFDVASGIRKQYIDPWSYILFRKLDKNSGFIEEFVQTYSHHMNTTFQPPRLRHFVDSLKSNIENEMHRHIDRWAPEGGTPDFETWENNFQKYYDFAELRTPHMWDILKKHYELNDTVFFILNHQKEKGSVSVYNVEVEPEHFSGYYFKDLAMVLKAEAKPGYSFKEWKVYQSDGKFTTVAANPFQYVPTSFNKIEAVYEVQKEIVINEISALNETIATDEFDEYDDWIELYNPNNFAVNVGGYYLTDDLDVADKWQIPATNPAITTIPAKGFLVFWADDQTEQGILHAAFKLSSAGEGIGISRRFGETVQFIDTLSFPALEADVSYGCMENGSDERAIFAIPTPGAGNDPNSTGLTDAEYHEFNLQVYPNPASEKLHILLNRSQNESPVAISLFDSSGRLAQQLDTEDLRFAGKVSVDVSGLKKGLYLLHVREGNISRTVKVMKK